MMYSCFCSQLTIGTRDGAGNTGVTFTVTINILRNNYAPVITNLPSVPTPIELSASAPAGTVVYQVSGSDNDTVVCYSGCFM